MDKITAKGWMVSDIKPDPETRLVLSIGLKQQNLAVFQAIFDKITRLDSPVYGKYLSRQEITAIVRPSDITISKVLQWLNAYDVTSTSLVGNDDWLEARMSLQTAEDLLQTEFYNFTHCHTGVSLIRALSYTVPQGLEQHIDLVGGVLRFPKHFGGFKEYHSTSPGLLGTTPASIKVAYNISITPSAPSNLQSIASFLEQYVNENDLKQFRAHFNLPAQTIAKIIGPNDPSNPGDEASLDIQYLMGVASGITTWVWSTGGEAPDQQEPFLTWLYAISNTTTAIPYVFSISYGDDELSVGDSYITRVSNEFQKVNIRGTTFVFASGDSGTQCNDACTKFQPDFPGDSPWVTVVGATASQTQSTPWSGGGFSNLLAQPSFQSSAVAAYLSQSTTPTSYFNVSGRGFPDVAAFGVNFQIVLDGGLTAVDGTSCSAPTFAAILSLINDLRLQKGLPTLGFANPFLYAASVSSPASFTDITNGDNQDGCCTYGFKATKGWDPVTGLGTPNTGILAEAALSEKIFPSFAKK
eukprot:TRINITY_DN285_c0_g1_i1.p1 TRINITY_DN285_c0_g1~~TRINITY_DN285_c0_g1_i1.p1  ORF type:complete len:551 (-),score=148.52 TRINITY_DN285_c0_g1_i1:51-1625(-)